MLLAVRKMGYTATDSLNTAFFDDLRSRVDSNEIVELGVLNEDAFASGVSASSSYDLLGMEGLDFSLGGCLDS
jgi:hypothetical protein